MAFQVSCNIWSVNHQCKALAKNCASRGFLLPAFFESSQNPKATKAAEAAYCFLNSESIMR
jgi:hypothetical protein